jgi:hypothetical protein
MPKELREDKRLSKSESKLPAGGRVLMIGRVPKINLVVLDLGRLVGGMRGELRRLLGRDIRFDVSLLSAGRCLVSASRHQMRELVLHLVLDARDAMPDGGSLSIAIEKRRIAETGSFHSPPSGEYVVVAVRDSPRRQIRCLSEQRESRVIKGRALSLAASYDAIRSRGGHISVSRCSSETMVRVFLPCLTSRAAQAAFGSVSR